MIYDLQRASMWKRISAFLFDGILVSIVAVFFAWVLSFCLNVDHYQTIYYQHVAQVQEEFGVDFQMSLSDYENMTDEQEKKMTDAFDALGKNQEAVWSYHMMMQLTIVVVSIGVLLAFLVMEFILPVIFKNGQTLGKKIFGIALMRVDGVRISRVSLFVRTVLGKYAIETMVPLLIIAMIYFNSIGIVGPLVILGLGLIQFCSLVFTHNHSLIHDFLSSTVAVDFASQMIFDTEEDMIAYKNKVHAEKVAKTPY